MFHVHVHEAYSGNKLWVGNPGNKPAAISYVLSSMADGSRDCMVEYANAKDGKALYFRQNRRRETGVDAFFKEVNAAFENF
jgi:hypothetical protein